MKIKPYTDLDAFIDLVSDEFRDRASFTTKEVANLLSLSVLTTSMFLAKWYEGYDPKTPKLLYWDTPEGFRYYITLS